jgi:glycine oxidase
MGDTDVHAEVTVVAAGAWSAEVWPEAAGLLPMRPVKGQILRLRGEPLLNHVLRTPDVYLVPREDGGLVVGATTEEQGFDTRVTTWAVMDLLREAWRVLPGVAELEMSEAIAGLRPALRDHQPAIGRTAIEGLLVATGHYRHGIVLAPVTAKLLAGVMDGTATVPPAFDPSRLTDKTRPGDSTLGYALKGSGLPSPKSERGPGGEV